MATKESVKIEVIDGEELNSKIFIMSLNIGGLGIYEKAKATKKFIDSETKVLEMVIETHLREILRQYGIIPLDGTESSLEKAFAKLEAQGKELEIRDRYYKLNDEKIIGQSANQMTVIQEGNILGCAIEILIKEKENG